MAKHSRPASSAIRPDIIRAVALALLTVLLWCTFYDRWTVASWQTPLTYLESPEKSDVMYALASIKATSEGHVQPFSFTNVPQLGAPFVANWDDFPSTEKPITWLTGLLASFMGVFAGANCSVMIAQVLAAVSFYAACRLAGGSWVWSFAGGLIFAFSRYAFAHGLHHLSVTYYWHVPLCLLVAGWIFRGEGGRWGDWRLIFALAVAFVTGIQNVYYTSLFAQFVLFGGLVQIWRRGWRAGLPAAGVVGSAVAAFVLMNLNTFLYHLIHGSNDQAVVRNYKWLEIYGLKIVDLVVPPPDHMFPPFADWGAQHMKEIILAPGEMPPTAYAGVIGLAALGWLTLASLRRVVEHRRMPLEAWMILWIILFAGVGGFNGILGALGVQLFRATTRYSIFILCIALMYAVGRLSAMKWKYPFLAYGAALLVAVIALFDQTPPVVSAQDLAVISQAVDSDRRFTEAMEKRLPPKAMVFQVPVMEFPETPAPGMPPYDHFRPYLFAHDLRFSFGTDKGRPEGQWQQSLNGLPLTEIIQELENYGFSAIYINRNAFSDKGENIVASLKSAGLTDVIENDDQTLCCVFLKPSAHPVLPDMPVR